MKPLDALEIKEFVNLYITNSRKSHAESFTNFIKLMFLSDPKNSVRLKFMDMTKMFFAQIDMYSSVTKTPNDLIRSIFLKFYDDSKEDVAKFLNFDSVEYIIGFGIRFDGMAKVMGANIPNYREIMSNSLNRTEWYDYVLANYSTDSNAMNPYALFTQNLTGNFSDPAFISSVFAETSSRFFQTMNRFESTVNVPLGQQYVSQATTPFTPPTNSL
jgi:hypothetical protein